VTRAYDDEHRRPFLTAEWRNLVVINWEVTADKLSELTPAGTVLDDFNGAFFVSLVGFQFAQTKLFGALPLFSLSSFEEVNLRFYVRRELDREVRRGVSFVKEIVPSRVIATTARVVYREPYVQRPMRHRVESWQDQQHLGYSWRDEGEWRELWAESTHAPRELNQGSFEEFILEHYWGYTRLSPRATGEYRVQHPRWRFAPADKHGIDAGVADSYGDDFARVLQGKAHSAFIAEGSPVKVFSREILNTEGAR
jgi:uncharacterized protein